MPRTEDMPQLAAMREGIDFRFPIKLRGFEIHVRPLSIDETMLVYSEVAEALASVPEKMRNRLVEQATLAKKTLVMASTSDVDEKDARITELVLGRFTPDELSHLFKEYTACLERVNPSLDRMAKADLDALVDLVKKNATSPDALASTLTELSFLQLANLTLLLLTKSD